MIDLKNIKELSTGLTVLYVEDDESLQSSVASYLRKLFTIVDTAINGLDGLELYRQNKYDLVLTDIKMPKMNGLDMANEIKKINDKQNILIISAYSDISNFITSIKLGIDGYIIKPIDFKQLNETLYKILYKIRKFKENENYKDNLERLIEEKTEETKRLQEDKIKNYKDTLYAMIKMIEDRDTYTGGHSQRVANYSKKIAIHMGVDESRCDDIYEAGILHDIGKIVIPDNILLKPSPLSDVEYKLIQEHVNLGVDILNKIPMFEKLVKYIEAHHERLNGSGYPKGLKGDEIPLEAQIMALSDSFDAMTTSRIYKAKKSVDQALREIESLKGIFFREDVVNAALEVLFDTVVEDNIDQLPKTKLEEERFSYFYKDQVTQSFNSHYLDFILSQNSYNFDYKYIYKISIHNLNLINKKYGWEYGNSILRKVATYLKESYSNELVFRIHSDDFILLSKYEVSIDTKYIESRVLVKELVCEIRKYNIEKDRIDSLTKFEAI